jgi:flagellar protein FliJ
MAVFRFSLAPLLRLRLHAEEQRKRALGEAMRAQEAAEATVRGMQAERDQAIALSDESPIFDPQERRQLGIFLYHLGVRIEKAEAVVQEKKAGVETATEALRQAVQQRKMLERLRELREGEHRLAESRHEQKALDEHAAHFLRRESQTQNHGSESD